MKVQWDQPLEVVYDNGDVFTPDESHGNYVSWIDGDGDRRRHFFKSDGRSNVSDNFRIRNKPAAAVGAEHAPEAPGATAEAPLGVLAGVERLERLEALVRRMAAPRWEDGDTLTKQYEEAAAIVALLPPLVDPDLLKARDIVAGLYEAGNNLSAEHRACWAKHCRNGAYDADPGVRAALAGIKAGREMGK